MIKYLRELIFIETFAGLAAQEASANHLSQQWVRTILGIAKLIVEHLHDGEVHVVTNEVGECQWAHWVVSTKHHALVDVLGTCDTVGENTNCLVNHWDKNAVNHKARSLVHGHWSLANLGSEVNDAFSSLVAGELATNYLNESHAVGWIEEVAANELCWTACASSNLGDRERR